MTKEDIAIGIDRFKSDIKFYQESLAVSKQEVEDLRLVNRSQRAENERLQTEIDRISKCNDQCLVENTQLKERGDAFARSCETLQVDVTTLHIELSEAKAKADALQIENERLRLESANRQDELGAARHDLSECQRALEEERRKDMCDACAGTGHPAKGIVCMCAGTGRMSVAAINLREALLSTERALDEARANKARTDQERRDRYIRTVYGKWIHHCDWTIKDIVREADALLAAADKVKS